MIARPIGSPLIALVAALVFVLAFASPGMAQEKLALMAGKVLTMDEKDTVLNNVIVFLKDRKIEKIIPQRGAVIPADYRVIDHRDKWLVPGLIDPHNHTSSEEFGSLVGEFGSLTNPGLRALDLAMPRTESNIRSLAGGVTTVLLIPGSATNLGGFGVVARVGCSEMDDFILKEIGSVKIAQAGNPERFYFRKGRSYMNYNLRQTLQKAKDYHEAWNRFESKKSKTQPKFDAHWESFRGLFRRTFPASVHTQIYQVVHASIAMLSDEFGIKLMIDHGTFDGYKLGKQVAERGIHAMIGPRMWWMDPVDRTINGTAAGYWKNGVKKIGLNTDAGVLPQEDLPMQGAMSVRYGFDTYAALKGMTYWAADSLGLANRIGSLQPGFDADIVVWSGNPIDFRSSVDKVYVLGSEVYNADERRIY
ncbi:MAG: amidohydrolase family protein [Planctomycetota bacterium]